MRAERKWGEGEVGGGEEGRVKEGGVRERPLKMRVMHAIITLWACSPPDHPPFPSAFPLSISLSFPASLPLPAGIRARAVEDARGWRERVGMERREEGEGRDEPFQVSF